MTKRDKSYDIRRKRPSKGFAQITYAPVDDWLEAVPPRCDRAIWQLLVFTVIWHTDKMKYFGEGRASMPDSPSLCVVDSNILIDLHVGGLLQEVFRLPLRLVAPDVIIEELQAPDGRKMVETAGV